MSNILTIGEAMGLFVSQEIGELKDTENYKRLVSGAEVNVSIGVTRLGHKVSFFTQLGKDPLGNHIIDFLKKENIDTSKILQIENYNTGIQLKGKTQVGDPEIFYYRKNSAASKMTIDNLKEISFDDIDLLHITGIFMALNDDTFKLVEELVKKARKNNVKISFDPNLRPSLWESKEKMVERINYIGSLSDYFLPGYGEAKILTNLEDLDEIADFYLNKGIKFIVFKMGSEGCIAYVKGNKKTKYESKGFRVDKIVDTVGAGDGFAVGIITGLLEDLSIQDILKRANAIGAIQITHQSDNEGLPNNENLEEFINKNS